MRKTKKERDNTDIPLIGNIPPTDYMDGISSNKAFIIRERVSKNKKLFICLGVIALIIICGLVIYLIVKNRG